ncbi:glycosyltransferase [Longibacter sp.]|jgi:glycosyltransferase involved in cell wall biosynthesis|uniref:glycosyltransferase n=1 Tax=Longibacter sp. TaxID=2045415 RepID=UPI003EBFD337
MPRILLISYRFPPETYPLAIGLKGVVDGLRSEYDIDVITAAHPGYAPPNVSVHYVPPTTLDFAPLRKLKLAWLADTFTWPDRFIPWVLPAYKTAVLLSERRDYDAILTFMMPYSTGFAGILAKRATGLPLILNFDDSPTCVDQNPSFSSRLHYAATRWMENTYVRLADTSVYVSERNMERVRERQPSEHRSNLHLIRYGATSQPPDERIAREQGRPLLTKDAFNIVYVGGMGGWEDFLPDDSPWIKRAYRFLTTALRYDVTDVDHRPHGPVYLGLAVRRLVTNHPDWSGRIRVHFFGNTPPHLSVNRILESHGIQDIVSVHAPVDHATARALQVSADCLFISLPARTDGEPSSIISSKTYEYLQTNRPILAALPGGENRSYLEGHPGVHLTPPSDPASMADALAPLVGDWMDGGREATSVNRSAVSDELGSDVRADEIRRLIRSLTESTRPLRRRSIDSNRQAYA